jgi:outer membrane lipoprotein carrier protein
MKTIFRLLVILFVINQLPAFSQDPKAGAVLDAMSKKYKALGSFQATFTYMIEGKPKETMKGDVTVKGTKFRLKLAGQEIYNNGQTVTTFVKETNEANISTYEPGDNDINPAKIYSIYKKGYKYKYIAQQKQGASTVEIIELTPENKAAQVKNLNITIDAKDKSVKSWKITDKSGKKTTFKIDTFKPNPAGVDDKYFAFDKAKYPGVEIVDLR